MCEHSDSNCCLKPNCVKRRLREAQQEVRDRNHEVVKARQALTAAEVSAHNANKRLMAVPPLPGDYIALLSHPEAHDMVTETVEDVTDRGREPTWRVFGEQGDEYRVCRAIRHDTIARRGWREVRAEPRAARARAPIPDELTADHPKGGDSP